MTIETKFGIGSGGGVHFKDPREMYRWTHPAANLRNMDNSGTAATSATAGFFTQQAIRGLADDTNWTADTYKTLLNATGMLLVSNLIGPTGLAGTPTTTWRITVDGTVYTVAVVATGVGYRAVLGPMSPDGSGGTAFTTAKVIEWDMTSISADKTTQTDSGGARGIGLWPWSALRTFGTPCLIARQSLLIEAKSSENNSTTTNKERQCAVQYMVLA